MVEYQNVRKVWEYVCSFQQNTETRQRLKQTDGRTERRILRRRIMSRGNNKWNRQLVWAIRTARWLREYWVLYEYNMLAVFTRVCNRTRWQTVDAARKRPVSGSGLSTSLSPERAAELSRGPTAWRRRLSENLSTIHHVVHGTRPSRVRCRRNTHQSARLSSDCETYWWRGHAWCVPDSLVILRDYMYFIHSTDRT